MPMSSAITSRAGSLAVNLFHVRGGKIVDRREFFWEDLPELLESLVRRRYQKTEESGSSDSPDAASFHPGHVFSALLKQLYIEQPYVPRSILVPVDFDDREALTAC